MIIVIVAAQTCSDRCPTETVGQARVRWTACGLGAGIVEKCVWFTAVFYVAVQSGSALVHGIASVSARLWTFLNVGR